MTKPGQVAAFILAGGASSRMGADKGLLELDGVPLVVRTARLLKPLASSVTIVGPRETYEHLGLRVIPDHDAKGAADSSKGARRGPLAGIATALASSQSSWNLIVACDLPYLTRDWLHWLIGRAVRSGGQVVIPRTRRGLEPLAALYRLECGPAIRCALSRGERTVREAIANFRMEIHHEREWRTLDPQGNVLKNMNTRRDYSNALNWWASNHRKSGKRGAEKRATPSVSSANRRQQTKPLAQAKPQN